MICSDPTFPYSTWEYCGLNMICPAMIKLHIYLPASTCVGSRQLTPRPHKVKVAIFCPTVMFTICLLETESGRYLKCVTWYMRKNSNVTFLSIWWGVCREEIFLLCWLRYQWCSSSRLVRDTQQPSNNEWQPRASTSSRITGDYVPKRRPEHNQTQPFM